MYPFSVISGGGPGSRSLAEYVPGSGRITGSSTRPGVQWTRSREVA